MKFYREFKEKIQSIKQQMIKIEKSGRGLAKRRSKK